ncbi:unnamed protein product [Caenorhabditis auriculariae]|uniref:CWH43-like N-terminal domain-containing protein n=1 Tax=Caenorhabditis auriculariae TaxID=2777116 RepID=A0A8S1HA14_9PELO|nr:unnamed protein product [Caenorhabditis auriculariae]
MAFDDDSLSLSLRKFVLIVAGLPLSGFIICVVCAFSQLASINISCRINLCARKIYLANIYRPSHWPEAGCGVCLEKLFLMYSPLRPLTGAFRFRMLCQLACGLNLLENICLLTLSSISSTEDHGLHKLSFVMFEVCATLYMLLATFLFHHSGRRRATSLGEKSYELKILMTSISVIGILTASYLYWRHNAYCEPGVYTLFALAEYAIVLANIAFHCTLYYDFHGKSVAFTSAIGSVGGGYSFLPSHIEKDT